MTALNVMPLQPGQEPIGDDELLYRRIPVSKEWYSSNSLSPEAFDPRADETTGISVYRGKYTSIQQAATGLSKKGYYVAVLKAGDLRAKGIQVEPRPTADDPGHAELPGLTSNNRRETLTLERKVWLAELSVRIEGPFTSSEHASE